jgi:hypothetical protein
MDDVRHIMGLIAAAKLITQDLEFASMMVIKLNMILITSPELADFRRRLKNLETKVSQRTLTNSSMSVNLTLAGWADAVLLLVSLVVSQPGCCLCTLSARPSV